MRSRRVRWQAVATLGMTVLMAGAALVAMPGIAGASTPTVEADPSTGLTPGGMYETNSVSGTPTIDLTITGTPDPGGAGGYSVGTCSEANGPMPPQTTDDCEPAGFEGWFGAGTGFTDGSGATIQVELLPYVCPGDGPPGPPAGGILQYSTGRTFLAAWDAGPAPTPNKVIDGYVEITYDCGGQGSGPPTCPAATQSVSGITPLAGGEAVVAGLPAGIYALWHRRRRGRAASATPPWVRSLMTWLVLAGLAVAVLAACAPFKPPAPGC